MLNIKLYNDYSALLVIHFKRLPVSYRSCAFYLALMQLIHRLVKPLLV